MTGGTDDRALRERFAALRSQETGAAPSFASVRARLPVAPRTRRHRAFALAAAAALLIGSLVLWPEPSNRNGERMSITEWKSPTDFLLQSPVAPLLQASPAVGERWVMVP